ncbi:hypothetical protein L9F63_022644, partial [Diploptera punctata]
LAMTESTESGLESVKLTTIKNEVYPQEGMEPEELELQASPHIYQQVPNIIVEVPVINGEPPAMLHSSRSTPISEFNMEESEKMDETTSYSREGNEMTCCKEESSTLSIEKREQIKRRREQNRFRMRALRASDSEVARRLRENNKFRMRMLRASGSQVAIGIRERNKFRMREHRSGESRLIEKCATFPLDIGECLKKDQFKVNFCLEGRQDVSCLELNSLKEELKSESYNITCICLPKEHLQVKSFNPVYSGQSQKQNLSDKSGNVTSSEIVNNIEQVSCNSINANYSAIVDKTQLDLIQNKYNCGVKEESKTGEMQPALCCIQSDTLESTALETRAPNNKIHSGPCIIHTGDDQVFGNFASQVVGKVGKCHRIKIQNDILSKDRNFMHFMRVGELEEQQKLFIKTLPVNQVSAPDIDDQRNQRRERGKLRMRLKRYSETEEEAQRRRERGRLRMRVLRASETEEQAARRRELNRIRMRMKRNSTKTIIETV